MPWIELKALWNKYVSSKVTLIVIKVIKRMKLFLIAWIAINQFTISQPGLILIFLVDVKQIDDLPTLMCVVFFILFVCL